MRVFLTGASGFIGSNLVETLLQQGCHVSALARPSDPLKNLGQMVGEMNVVRSELKETEVISRAMDQFKPDTCIHLAWYAEPKDYLHSLQNIKDLKESLDLLNIMATVGCRNILMVGTCAEYDTRISPLKEDSPTRPETLYAAAKLALLLVCQQIAKQKDLNFSWARIFYLFGPNENEGRLIPSVIRSLKENLPFMTTEGAQERDYLYVKDVASALSFIASSRFKGIFNICSGKCIILKDLISKTARLMDKEDFIHFGAIPYREWEPMRILGDNQKLRNAGWEAKYSLEEGLTQTVDWWLCKQDR